MRKIILLAVAVLLLGCIGANVNQSSVTNAGEVTISEIRSNPNEFIGKVVVINGTYMGWKGNEPPPLTRSDWVVDDGTGQIYITGIIPNLDPVKDIGKNVTVVGYVGVIDGKPYIKAIDVKVH